MLETQLRKIIISGLQIALLLLIALLISSPSNSQSKVIEMEVQYAGDFADDQQLVGASHNIFVGKVIRQIGAEERGIGPETQFQVEVVENIKGELRGAVTVNQEGGYRNGALYVFESDRGASGYLLKPGSTYLLATRYNEELDWHTLNSYPTASKLISDRSLSRSALAELVANETRVWQLKEAYPREVLIEADVIQNNTRNAFSSTTPPRVE